MDICVEYLYILQVEKNRLICLYIAQPAICGYVTTYHVIYMCNSDIYRDMRNILTIYTQYDGGKVAPELGGKGYSFVHPTPSPPVIFSAQLATQLCRSTFERCWRS